MLRNLSKILKDIIRKSFITLIILKNHIFRYNYHPNIKTAQSNLILRTDSEYSDDFSPNVTIIR